jgi:hypothetical protein
VDPNYPYPIQLEWTRRDTFALEAMKSILAVVWDTESFSRQWVADQCYLIANAMEYARQQLDKPNMPPGFEPGHRPTTKEE